MNGFKFLKETMNLAGISRGVEGGGSQIKVLWLGGVLGQYNTAIWLIFVIDPPGYPDDD